MYHSIYYRRLHCKSNSLHINLFIAFILRAIISFIKSSLFVEGVGLEKDIYRDGAGDIKFIENMPVRNEPPRGKTNNVVSEQVRHKSGCTVTEAG